TGRDPRDEPPFSFPPAYGLNPSISKRTSDALQKALQMNAEDRFQSIAEFRAALRPLPATQPQVPASQKTTVLPPQVATPAPAPAPARPPTRPAAAARRPAGAGCPRRAHPRYGWNARCATGALAARRILSRAAGGAACAGVDCGDCGLGVPEHRRSVPAGG